MRNLNLSCLWLPHYLLLPKLDKDYLHGYSIFAEFRNSLRILPDMVLQAFTFTVTLDLNLSLNYIVDCFSYQ